MLNLSIDSMNLEQSFDRIASNLFNQYILSIGEESYQVTEIEFYYNNEEQTIDNFAHVHGDKYPNGTWRLHGAGLDIVLKEKDVYYGGILIRGIQKLDKKLHPMFDEIVDGPWNTAEQCISGLGKATDQQSFHLTKLDRKLSRVFVKSPRVGLFLKKEEDLEYICKPWRYTSIPILTKKYRHLIFLQLCLDKGRIDVEQKNLIAQLNLSEKTKTNYLRYFEAGKTMQKTQFIRIKRTVENTCQLFGNYFSRNDSKL